MNTIYVANLVDAIFLTAQVGLAFVDTDLRYVRMNDALARIQGRRMEEVLDVAARSRVFAAVWLGKTRLIDNMPIG